MSDRRQRTASVVDVRTDRPRRASGRFAAIFEGLGAACALAATALAASVVLVGVAAVVSMGWSSSRIATAALIVVTLGSAGYALLSRLGRPA